MATTTDLLVLDTSVVVGWIFDDEPHAVRALATLDAVRRDPARFVIPPLLHSELAHVCARRSRNDERFVAEVTRLVLSLGIRTLSLPESALKRLAHWTCSGLGGYDATFVALAEDLGGRWLTADEKAARRVGSRLAMRLATWKSPR